MENLLLKRGQFLRRFSIALSGLMMLIGPGEGTEAVAKPLTLEVEITEAINESPIEDPLDPQDSKEENEIIETNSPNLEVPNVHVLLSHNSHRNLSWRYADLFSNSGSSGVERRPPLVESIDSLSIVHDAKIEGHIRYFHIAIRDRFEQWLTRLEHYKPLVENIFSEFDLPNDLVFLSLVESGFNPHAYSRARATGPWQFMKGTARIYGLRVDQYVDERRDPIKSTVAAARYLRDLYDLFGAWPLAMAAYNAGEGKVMRALRKARAEDYWEISRTKHIRRETKEYVPRFMAATIIAKNPGQYGFELDRPPVHQFEETIINRPIELRALSDASGISLTELRRLNPELRLDITPPDIRDYRLKIPIGAKTMVDQALKRIPAWKASPSHIKNLKNWNRGKDRTESHRWYRVRMGDNLWTIAKRVHLTVQQLKARNSFTTRGIKPGDLLAVGPR